MSSWGAGGKWAVWGKPPCPETWMPPYCTYDEQQGDWRCRLREQWYGDGHVRSFKHTKNVAWFQHRQGPAVAATQAPEPAATAAATSAPFEFHHDHGPSGAAPQPLRPKGPPASAAGSVLAFTAPPSEFETASASAAGATALKPTREEMRKAHAGLRRLEGQLESINKNMVGIEQKLDALMDFVRRSDEGAIAPSPGPSGAQLKRQLPSSQ